MCLRNVYVSFQNDFKSTQKVLLWKRFSNVFLWQFHSWFTVEKTKLWFSWIWFFKLLGRIIDIFSRFLLPQEFLNLAFHSICKTIKIVIYEWKCKNCLNEKIAKTGASKFGAKMELFLFWEFYRKPKHGIKSTSAVNKI